jgi:hypothetical protein
MYGVTVNASGISHITGGNFAQSANTINGWLRDLWAQSSSYSIIRFCFISVWFNFLSVTLFGHSVLCSYSVVVTGKN